MFKDIIKDIIKESGLSQEKFAKKIGSTQGTVSKWLSGVQEPRYTQLKRICEAFNVDANYLLDLTEY